jgi:hypothetical protein
VTAFAVEFWCAGAMTKNGEWQKQPHWTGGNFEACWDGLSRCEHCALLYEAIADIYVIREYP